MKRILRTLVAASAFAALHASAQPAPEVTLTRLDCGNGFNDQRRFEKGPVVLAGDAAHFHENYRDNGVPGFNYDRVETIASLERIKQIEKNLRATVIIQHDPRDIGKLPAFPAAAR